MSYLKDHGNFPLKPIPPSKFVAIIILNIKYNDSDKEIILTVLSKISSAYQDYSGRRTERNITMGINYLSQQIS